MRGISIVVCCYNSANRLRETLRHIAEQRTPADFLWEVIIVDNASEDETAEIARLEWAKYCVPIPFRVVHEGNAGLSHARDRGISEARHDYIIFCDDDNWLDASYVANAHALMERYPDAGAIGGQAMAVFEKTQPKWFDKFQKHFAVGAQGTTIDGVEDLGDKQRYVFGAAAVFRKEALNKLHSLRHRLVCSDRREGALLSGGDNELCYCLLLLGYRILYSGSLRFQHFMPSVRLTISYLLRLNYGAGYSQAMLMSYAPFLSSVPEKKIRWHHQLMVNILWWLRATVVDAIFKGGDLLEWRVSAQKRMGAIAAVWKERRRIALQVENNRKLQQSTSFGDTKCFSRTYGRKAFIEGS